MLRLTKERLFWNIIVCGLLDNHTKWNRKKYRIISNYGTSATLVGIRFVVQRKR
jgi:hypothetical protein